MEGHWFANLHSAYTPLLPIFAGPEWTPKGPYPGVNENEAMDRAKRARIIVIDDEGIIAETVVEILKQEGYEAVAVATGDSAVELARTWTPDIVLSDVIMPGLNGIEAGIRIREIVPQCKIILFFRTGGHRRFAAAGPRRWTSIRYPRQADQAGAVDLDNPRCG